MPTYRNDRSDLKTISLGGYSFRAGSPVQTNRYFTLTGELGFVSHAPAIVFQPIKELKNSLLVNGESVVVDLNYPVIQVRNESGSPLRISFNTTSGESIYVEDNERQVFTQHQNNIGTMRLSGEGAGTVNIVNMF